MPLPVRPRGGRRAVRVEVPAGLGAVAVRVAARVRDARHRHQPLVPIGRAAEAGVQLGVPGEVVAAEPRLRGLPAEAPGDDLTRRGAGPHVDDRRDAVGVGPRLDGAVDDQLVLVGHAGGVVERVADRAGVHRRLGGRRVRGDGGRVVGGHRRRPEHPREPLRVGGRDVAAGHVAEGVEARDAVRLVLERGEDVQCVPVVDVLLRGVQQVLLVDVRLVRVLVVLEVDRRVDLRLGEVLGDVGRRVVAVRRVVVVRGVPADPVELCHVRPPRYSTCCQIVRRMTLLICDCWIPYSSARSCCETPPAAYLRRMSETAASVSLERAFASPRARGRSGRKKLAVPARKESRVFCERVPS